MDPHAVSPHAFCGCPDLLQAREEIIAAMEAAEPGVTGGDEAFLTSA